MFSNTPIERRAEIKTETGVQMNDPDTSRISQTIDRFAWLTGIAATLLIPLSVLGYGYISQYKSISNEAVILSSMIRQHQQFSVINGEKSAIKQMVKDASTNSESDITLTPENISNNLSFPNYHDC